LQLFQNISYLDLGEGKMGEDWAIATVGAGLLTRVGVARWKAWPSAEQCLLKFSIIVDLSVVIVFPSLSAVGSWEEVLLFSMDLTVSLNILEFLLQDANFCLKNLAFAFLCIMVPKFPEKLHVVGTIRY
jgi:hypothetical protein